MTVERITQDPERAPKSGTGVYQPGDIIAQKCGVPHLYRFEVFGTPDDVATVHEGLEEFWKQQP